MPSPIPLPFTPAEMRELERIAMQELASLPTVDRCFDCGTPLEEHEKDGEGFCDSCHAKLAMEGK